MSQGCNNTQQAMVTYGSAQSTGGDNNQLNGGSSQPGSGMFTFYVPGNASRTNVSQTYPGPDGSKTVIKANFKISHYPAKHG